MRQLTNSRRNDTIDIFNITFDWKGQATRAVALVLVSFLALFMPLAAQAEAAQGK
jgi:hypothetical protein